MMSGPLQLLPEIPLVILIFMTPQLVSGVTEKPCGVLPKSEVVPPSKRIVGGGDTEITSNPWMARIFNLNFNPKGICGGSVINSQYILTAAHCVSYRNGSRFQPKELKVLTGETYGYARNDKLSSVEEIFVHEGYTLRRENNHKFYFGGEGIFDWVLHDVALLKLEYPLELDESHVETRVCLPGKGVTADELTSLDCKVAGWGYTYYDGKSHPTYAVKLQQFFLDVRSNGTCSKHIDDTQYNWFLCAEGRGGEGTCGGDSGGPLVCRDTEGSWFQAGVVSFSVLPGCAVDEYPDFFVDVSKYLDWMHEIMGEDAPPLSVPAVPETVDLPEMVTNKNDNPKLHL